MTTDTLTPNQNTSIRILDAGLFPNNLTTEEWDFLLITIRRILARVSIILSKHCNHPDKHAYNLLAQLRTKKGFASNRILQLILSGQFGVSWPHGQGCRPNEINDKLFKELGATFKSESNRQAAALSSEASSHYCDSVTKSEFLHSTSLTRLMKEKSEDNFVYNHKKAMKGKWGKPGSKPEGGRPSRYFLAEYLTRIRNLLNTKPEAKEILLQSILTSGLPQRLMHFLWRANFYALKENPEFADFVSILVNGYLKIGTFDLNCLDKCLESIEEGQLMDQLADIMVLRMSREDYLDLLILGVPPVQSNY